MNFTEAVEAAMEAKGVSKADLARSTQRSYQYISDLLKGERRWHEGIINEVCAALGIHVEFNYDTNVGQEKQEAAHHQP
ncbi:helix-turn-helix domain-containing protein [Paenibacillus farraposensis]|uniref:Helix-turn-helix domain-containing protein n=1 Tax=Paenibacillus farraposensis TaxID=2807095 RepID=A0ABW4DCQ9_9BACL|nr:helix-turn-helix transcriptional regulator [Paenibacillus farraposensis]MCC3379871.1 helix-turn-helix transcriptional regulator [Paenibacillus farraposensis]